MLKDQRRLSSRRQEFHQPFIHTAAYGNQRGSTHCGFDTPSFLGLGKGLDKGLGRAGLLNLRWLADWKGMAGRDMMAGAFFMHTLPEAGSFRDGY